MYDGMMWCASFNMPMHGVVYTRAKGRFLVFKCDGYPGIAYSLYNKIIYIKM